MGFAVGAVRLPSAADGCRDGNFPSCCGDAAAMKVLEAVAYPLMSRSAFPAQLARAKGHRQGWPKGFYPPGYRHRFRFALASKSRACERESPVPLPQGARPGSQ
jgi:hypothetical protein